MAQKRILVVEDDPSMRKILHARLKAENYDAVPVADVVSAFGEVRKHTTDLILLDLGIPGGGGLNLMQRLQSIPKLATIPIVVVSARERTGIEAEVLDGGAVAFFQKPIDFDELLKKIREMLGEA